MILQFHCRLPGIPEPKFQVETTIANGIELTEISDPESGFRLRMQRLAPGLAEFLELFYKADDAWRRTALKTIWEYVPTDHLTVGILYDMLRYPAPSDESPQKEQVCSTGS